MATSDIGLLVTMCVIAGLMCLTEVVRLLQICGRALQTDGEWSSMVLRIAGWLFCGSSGTRPPNDDDGQERRLLARLAEIRVESYVAFLNVMMPLSAAIASTWIFRLFMGLPRLSNPVTAGNFALAYTAGLVVRVYPSLLNQKTVWILHFWLMGLLFCQGAYLAVWNADWFLLYYPSMVLTRTLLSIVYPVAVSNNYWNAAWVAVAILGHRNNAETRAEVPLNNTIGNELVVAVFLSWVIWKIEWLQASQIRSDIQAHGYLKAKNTMGKLLADMCDAVVELGPDLQIQKPCPKLAGLLLREQSTSSLNNESFSSLVLSEEDRERFSGFVAERTVPMELEQDMHGQRQPSSMFLSLRDVIGTAVPVQLFHSCHHDSPEELCHIIGVREVEDRGHQDAAQDTLGETGQRAGQQDETESVVSGASVATGSWAPDVPIVMAPLLPENITGAPINVIFNPFTYQIIASTIGFQSLTGPHLYKATLGDFIVNFQEFCAWALTEVNGFFMNGMPQKIQLKVAPSLAKRQASFEFHADAFIIEVREGIPVSAFGVEQPAGADEEQFDMLCVLVLCKPEAKWQREKKQPKRLARHYGPAPQPAEYTMAL